MPGSFAVIAHRGASGYLPEHTLEGTAMAHAMGVDYIEHDVVLTRDGALIVLHDLFLEAVTDVSQQFAGRQRNDGHFYAIDFDLEEIRRLHVHERYPGRFPRNEAVFRIPTFGEELLLIQGLNESTGREAGVYVEPKSPAWHQKEGRDVVAEVIRELAHFGYLGREDMALLQSFDFVSLQRARDNLHCDLRLVQLIGENEWQESDTDFDRLRSAHGLDEIAETVDGIGPWLPHVMQSSPLVSAAHERGLFVHAYTLKADQLPHQLTNLPDGVKMLRNEVGLDGVFTDHPDKVLSCL